MTHGTLLFLGTGASAGIPVIGCECAVCKSQNFKNKRLRSSALIRYQGQNFLVDAGPDLRQQALQHEIKTLDGILLTHSHYDHIGGVEELRVYNFRQMGPITCLLSEDTHTGIKKIFHYIFESGESSTKIDCQVLHGKKGSVQLGKLHVHYFSYFQNHTKVTGYRFGDLAYVTDIKNYADDIFEELKGLKTLVLSALRFTGSAVQFSIDEAVDFAEKVQAEKTYLMHLAHEVEHDHLARLLPNNITPAYDGLEIPFYLRVT